MKNVNPFADRNRNKIIVQATPHLKKAVSDDGAKNYATKAEIEK